MRILLAEDERALSRALVTIFTKNNYSVDVVYNGEDAVNYIESNIYDIAILDIMMPKLDGLSALKQIRANKIKTPIIMLTAKDEVEDIEQGLDLGADDYVTKPFSVKELLARIRAVSRRGVISSEPNLEFGELILSRTDFTLSSPKGSLRLPNKEYQMIEMLMISPGKVISSERFMEKIWGYDSETEINVVWVYLSYIRKKLATLTDSVEIRAMRNSGYYLTKKDD